jgi:chitinase
VTLSSAATFPVTVDYATSDGTAAAGVDYAATSGTLTFAPGETTKTIDVTVTGESVSPTETLNLNLSNASNGTISTATGVGTINAVEDLSDNTNGPPEAGVGYGLTAASFETGASAVDLDSVSVGFVTRPDSVTIYTDNSGQPGSVVGTLTYSDGMYTASGITLDANTTYWVVNAGGGWWRTIPGAGTGDGYLGGSLKSDNGGASWSDATDVATLSFLMQVKTSYAGPSISISPAAVGEEIGNNTTQTMHYTVTLSSAATFPVTVHYATADGSNTSGDYTPTSGTLTFAPGQTTKTIDVTVNGNSQTLDETFYVVLSDPTNGSVADGTGVGTIAPVWDLSDNLSAETAEPVNVTSSLWLAQSFNSFGNTTLYSVTLPVMENTPGTLVAAIYTDSSGAPGTLVGTLTSPGSLSTESLANATFTTNGIALDSGTYWVVLKALDDGFFSTANTSDTSGIGPGFRASDKIYTLDGGSTWMPNSGLLQMKVLANFPQA